VVGVRLDRVQAHGGSLCLGRGVLTRDYDAAAVEGRIAEGQETIARTEVFPGRAFPVTVTALESPRRMARSGGMPLGLRRSERTSSLTPADGGTTFRVREEFTGPLRRHRRQHRFGPTGSGTWGEIRAAVSG
jgi:hypothetical protein